MAEGGTKVGIVGNLSQSRCVGSCCVPEGWSQSELSPDTEGLEAWRGAGAREPLLDV